MPFVRCASCTCELPGHVETVLSKLLRILQHVTYAVEENSNSPIGVKCRLVTSELGHFAHKGNEASDAAVEVRSRDARGGKLFGHCGCLNAQ